MASLLWMLVALSAGFGLYFLVPLFALPLSVDHRHAIGKPYLKMGTRLLKQFAFVRRVLSGYDILPISVDAEKKELNVTLASSTLGDDDEYRFNDPDNRIKRLWNKPVSLNFEMIPAAVDAKLSELGHWVREKRVNEGLYDGDPIDDWENVTVDPYVEVDDGLRLIDPIDVFELVPSNIDPEDIKTAEAHTKQRYSKYGQSVELADIFALLMGFATGMIFMGGAAYVNQRLLRGSSGGGGINVPVDSFGLGGYIVDPTWMDLVVSLL